MICPKHESHLGKTWSSFPDAKGKANILPMSFLNQKAEEIDEKENTLKKALWEIEDTLNEVETEDWNAEIITHYLTSFAGMYENLEAGEKKLYVESLVKRVEIGKRKEIKLTLHIPLEKFRVFIPDISATGSRTPV